MKGNHLLKEMKQINPGDHMVMLYDNKNLLQNVGIISSYIISRISNNEKCIYIYDETDIQIEYLLKKLREISNIDLAIDKEQFLILNKNDAYSKEGKFVPEKMILLLKELSLSAIKSGYTALAITGEISWVLEYEDGFQRIMKYEYLLNKDIFGSYPVSAICRYNINKFSSKMIKNIIEVHPIIIWKDKIHENPFYFNLINIDELNSEKYQVQSMLRSIDDYTYKKTRFENQIKRQENKYKDLQLHILKDIIVSLTSLLEIHDTYTQNHSQNVANYAKKIAEQMGLSSHKIEEIYYAGLVHDIGKTLIPLEIINKKGKLTNEEYKVVKKHPLIGYQALSKSKELKNIAHIVLSHHERWDGKGYPNNLKGNEISIESRILSIADSFDAMTSDRPYRKAFSKTKALNEIELNKGQQFDPTIAEISINKVFTLLEI